MFFGEDSPKQEEKPELNPEDIVPTSRPFDDVEMSKEEQDRWASLYAVVNTVKDAYNTSKDARTSIENTWTDSFLSWKGEYTSDELAKISENKQRNATASEVFIKITKTKATAALGQIQEILFSGEKYPIGIEPTTVPDGVAEDAFIVPESLPIPQDIYGYEGDGKTMEPGATAQSLLAGTYTKFKNLLQGKKVIEGPSPDPKSFPQISPAKEAAQEMEKVILDQFEEGDLRGELRRALWECVILGTGCIKGPLTYKNTIHTWKNNEGQISYEPKVEDIPKSSYVSIWNLYPDPDACSVDDASYIVEKHIYSRNQVAQLKRYAHFDKDAVDRVLQRAPIRQQESWEHTIKDTNSTFAQERYEILEYWGYLEKQHIEMLKPELKELLATVVDQAQVNCWICGEEILRLVINPFVPARLPYCIVPYEENVNSIWGCSIPENMKDPQTLMNGHMRMMIDNLKLSGNVMLEVNENFLVPGQSNEIYDGRVWRTQAGAGQKTINAIEIPNVAQQHMMAFDKARQLADEATGQPSYSYGQSGITSTTRTAAGMSMLMSAAAGNIKQVVRNIDDYLLKPLGEAYFAWNMQFNPKSKIRGDLKIVAKGTAALMQKEVQSQRLLAFLQIVSGNQLLTPFANLDYILRQIAISLDLDPEKTVNNPDMAKLVAEIIGMAGGNAASSAPEQPQEAGMAPPAGANPQDMTGGGGSTIGVGAAAPPGTQQFSGQ